MLRCYDIPNVSETRRFEWFCRALHCGVVQPEADAQSFMTAFPDLRVKMDELVESSDGVEYHWTLTGTHSGPGGTGNAVRISGFERWQFGEGGLIAVSMGEFDSGEYERQLAPGSSKRE